MFGAKAGRSTATGGPARDARARGRASRRALLFAAALAVVPGARAQTLEEWIQRFGEAAAEQTSAAPRSPADRSRPGSLGAAAPEAFSAAPDRGAGRPSASRACGAALAGGDLVLRSGGDDECAILQLTTAVRDAAQAMNERRPARESARSAGRSAARDSGRDSGCDSDEACRRNVRVERLKEVAALKHEEEQMARTHNAPRNVAVPPPARKSGSWSWQTYQLGR